MNDGSRGAQHVYLPYKVKYQLLRQQLTKQDTHAKAEQVFSCNISRSLRTGTSTCFTLTILNLLNYVLHVEAETLVCVETQIEQITFLSRKLLPFIN